MLKAPGSLWIALATLFNPKVRETSATDQTQKAQKKPDFIDSNVNLWKSEGLDAAGFEAASSSRFTGIFCRFSNWIALGSRLEAA